MILLRLISLVIYGSIQLCVDSEFSKSFEHLSIFEGTCFVFNSDYSIVISMMQGTHSKVASSSNLSTLFSSSALHFSRLDSPCLFTALTFRTK